MGSMENCQSSLPGLTCLPSQDFPTGVSSYAKPVTPGSQVAVASPNKTDVPESDLSVVSEQLSLCACVYSYRNATIGSTRAALCAGSKAAKKATASRINSDMARSTGSCARTSNSSDCSNRAQNFATNRATT